MTLDGITLLRYGVLSGSPAALNSGTISYSTGCVILDQGGIGGLKYVVIWPPQTRLERAGGQLRVVVDDLSLQEGDTVMVGGGSYKGVDDVKSLTGSIPAVCKADNYWLASSVERQN